MSINRSIDPIFFSDRKIKVITIIQSGCAPCIIELKEWEKYIKNKKFNNIEFIFIAIGGSNFYTDNQIKKNNFNFPIFYDKSNTFIEKNGLFELISEHTFILNRNNKIIFIGSPILNKSIRNSFIKTINNKKI